VQYSPLRRQSTGSYVWTTVSALLISGSNNPLNGNLNRGCKPAQRVRLRDAPGPLDLADPLLSGARLAAFCLGGVVDTPDHIGLGQAKAVTLFHHEPAER
jgi:hypothetical protein